MEYNYNNVLFQIANFYGATNDEYSQPRHCWDSSGKYIYGVAIIFFKFLNQTLIQRWQFLDFPGQVYCGVGN